MKKNILLVVLGTFILTNSFAQKKNDAFRLHIRKTTAPVIIDGVIDEKAWKECDVANDFFMVLPYDTGKANEHSEIRMTYDDTYIYLAAIFYHSTEARYYVESLRRDFAFGKNDNFLSFIDTYNDQTNGFSFGISAAGAQWDGTQSNGGSVGLDWDTKWKSAVKSYPDKWVAEFAIPFRRK